MFFYNARQKPGNRYWIDSEQFAETINLPHETCETYHRLSVTSTPGYVGDEYRIEIRNDQVRAEIDVYSKTAQIAGWSVVNTLRNITSSIVF